VTVFSGDLCYKTAVMLKQRILRVLGAAVVLIVLSFAPSVAQAHAGHEHHAAAHVHGGQGQAAADQAEQSATPVPLQQLERGQADMPAASDRNCVGACCSLACAACCAAGLPSFVALVPFPQLTTRVGFAPPQIWPDREPESLRRPPKYFI
jgi:hypothetical protein